MHEIDITLPSELATRMRELAAKLNVSPLNFLRKSIELHIVHHSPEAGIITYYPDQDQLHDAYRALDTDKQLKQLHEIERATYVYQNAEEAEGKPQGVDGTGCPLHASIYVSSEVYDHIAGSGSELPATWSYRLSSELGIAATHELIALYSLIEPGTETTG